MKSHRSLIVFASLVGLFSSQARAISDNCDSLLNWAISSQSGSASVNTTDQRMNIFIPADGSVQLIPSTAANGTVVTSFPYPALVGSVLSDWHAQVDMHLNTSLTASGAFGIQFIAFNLQDATFSHGMNVGLQVWGAGGTPVLFSNVWGSNLTNSYIEAGSSISNVSVLFNYTASDHTLSSSIKFEGDPGFTTLHSFDVTNAWGMNGAQSGTAFGISLNAGATSVPIGAGDLYFNSLIYEGSSEGAWPAAVPEPSTYAALVGATALGFGLVRRSRLRLLAR